MPPGLLLGTEVWAVEKFLEAENLGFLFRGSLDQLLGFLEHLLADVFDGVFLGRPFTVGLDESATHDPRHQKPPVNLFGDAISARFASQFTPRCAVRQAS